MIIEGTVTYLELGTGFWGIIGKNGEKWHPTNLPESLKKEGTKVSLNAEKSKDQMSVFMWGVSVKILA